MATYIKNGDYRTLAKLYHTSRAYIPQVISDLRKITGVPANIAQIAAASAVSPAAGAGAALLIASGAAMDLVNERTLTTGARRLASEAQAVGIDDEGLAQAAVQAAVGTQVSKSAGAYDSASMTASGQSASEATTSWLADVVGAEIGRNLSTGSAAQSTTFDSNAIAAAMKDLA